MTTYYKNWNHAQYYRFYEDWHLSERIVDFKNRKVWIKDDSTTGKFRLITGSYIGVNPYSIESWSQWKHEALTEEDAFSLLI